MSVRVSLTVGLLLSAVLAGCSGSTTPEKVDCAKLISNADGTNAKHTKIQFDTNYGTFFVELFDDASPITAANFKQYVEDGFFDHIVFHRIIKAFMMQGGKFDNTTKLPKPGQRAPIELEAFAAGCKNEHYTLSMARRGGADTKTATSEFFVNFKYNDFLDATAEGTGYTVFGIVYDGRDTVDKIEQVPVHVYNAARDPMCQDERGTPNCPDRPVEIISARVLLGEPSPTTSTSSTTSSTTSAPTNTTTPTPSTTASPTPTSTTSSSPYP